MTAKLTKEETEILDSFENSEWVPVADLSQRRKSWSSINHLPQHFLNFFPLPQGAWLIASNVLGFCCTMPVRPVFGSAFPSPFFRSGRNSSLV